MTNAQDRQSHIIRHSSFGFRHSLQDPRQLAQIRLQHRLRAAPHQEEQRLAAPAARRVARGRTPPPSPRPAPPACCEAPGCSPRGATRRSSTAAARARRPTAPPPARRSPLAAPPAAEPNPVAARASAARKSTAARVRPNASVEVCSPPVPAPAPLAITFSTGPATIHRSSSRCAFKRELPCVAGRERHQLRRRLRPRAREIRRHDGQNLLRRRAVAVHHRGAQ